MVLECLYLSFYFQNASACADFVKKANAIIQDEITEKTAEENKNYVEITVEHGKKDLKYYADGKPLKKDEAKTIN